MLGLSIIGRAEGRRPTLAKVAEGDKALGPLLEEIVEGLLRDRAHGRAFIRWLAYRAVPYRSEHEFESYPAYWDYVRKHEIRTLRGELVKSDCGIAASDGRRTPREALGGAPQREKVRPSGVVCGEFGVAGAGGGGCPGR